MYVDDIPVDDDYFALIIRSPAACGTLKSVSSPELPPPFLLITAADIPGENTLFDADIPLLAAEKISYAGEPVALLVGPDSLKLEEYAAQCVIEIEEGTPEFSIEDACEAGHIFLSKKTESNYPVKAEGNSVVEGHYETGIQEHWYSEPHGAIAGISVGGFALTIKTAAQRPNEVRETVAKTLGLGVEQVTIENTELGIHFDGKIWYPSVIASLAALASVMTKKIVKLQLSREEDYLFSPKRTPSVIYMRSSLKSDGQILDTSATIKIGFGAAAALACPILEETVRYVSKVYKMGKVSAEALAVRNNFPPTGPFAGFGAALTAFAVERHISKITDLLGENGAEWRRDHLQSKVKARFEGDSNAGSAAGGGVAGRDILGAVSLESGFKRKWAAYELLRGRCDAESERMLPQRGVGVSFAVAEEETAETAPPPAAACVIEVEIDRINYESTIRGIWMNVLSGLIDDQAKAGLVLRRAIYAALGWATTEKIKFTDGKIEPHLCGLYQMLPASAMPPIYIQFVEEEGVPCSYEKLERTAFSTIPAAYTQAVSQAVNHHFERIPITGQDVWRVINLKKQEAKTEEEAVRIKPAENKKNITVSLAGDET
ncbi:MAG: xanthine dehydrogenase family protein molybdopterin-binding subunit [Spirochaetaceae bacterium]|nr:xanthine dehydrogenase family protein molybdopterin-binding subunit [Spirochaetaceae bacterium]